jgi:hypothetical protein
MIASVTMTDTAAQPSIDAAPSPPVAGVRVRGWKEIGRWFGVDERTVKRWEAGRGLPIRRVPGEPRAPVFAYEVELAAWLQSRPAGEVATSVAVASAAHPGVVSRPRIDVVIIVIAVATLAVIALLGWQSASAERDQARDRASAMRELALGQVTTLGNRLENLSGTVALRLALAQEAARLLEPIAAAPDASPALRQGAADAWRLLARVQSATDRPSLRDRKAARASLDRALAIINDDGSVAAGRIRAQILIDAARHAAADGALDRAPSMLDEAAAAAADADPPLALREELLLAQSEIAQWQGRYPVAIARAAAVRHAVPADPEGWLRQVRAADLGAEAQFYAGNRPAATSGYRTALAVAEAGAARFGDQPAFRWAVQRQQWNLGTTLLDGGDAAAALPLLAASRQGWMTFAAADPADESVASWLRTARLSYGEGLAAVGRHADAITELRRSLADRRVWLAGHPDHAEAQRGLVVGLSALADRIGPGGEACSLGTEAKAMIAAMAGVGSLTALDRGSIAVQVANGVTRDCGAMPKT